MVIKDDFPNIRIYNQAAPNQIAAIVPDESNKRKSRDIIIEQKDSKLRRISHRHAAYLPLSYVLLFPRGDMGYTNKIVYMNKNN